MREAERLAHFGRWRWVKGAHAPTWSAGIARLLDWREDKLPRDGNWHRVLVHPEDRDELLSKFLDAFHHDGSITCISRFRAGSGSYRYIKTHAYAELDAGAQVEAIVGLAEDVTEEIQSALALRQSEAKYRLVAERASDVIGHCAPDGSLTFLSSSIEKTLGYSAEELPTLAACNALIHRDDFARMQPVFDKFRKGGDSILLEYRFLHKLGHYIWLETTMRGLRDASNGRITELVIISRDITERKSHEMALLQARERAEEASRIKSQFLANMSHELRTPLNAIIGFSDILKMEMFGSLGSDRYREYAQLINESGALLLDLISDILDMSKIEAGKYELHCEKLDITAIIAATSRLMRSRAGQLNLILTESISPEAAALPLLADERAFKQILLNLLSNALKFTPAGGEVRVAVEARPGGITLIVSDTGKGIPEDQISRLAQPFEQVSSKSEPGHQGTGLGLALVRSLAELHGGGIRIESQLGKGTSVSVFLPLTPLSLTQASA
jgi:PAS domain S-box-containing protein